MCIQNNLSICDLQELFCERSKKNADFMRFSSACGEKMLAFTGFCAYL